MIISDGMEILLRIERATQEKSKVAIRGLDDICNLVYGLTPIEGALVSEAVFDGVREYDACTEVFSDVRWMGGVNDRRAVKRRRQRRWLPMLRRCRTNT